jgi:pimeloyl-ACP methyl ester carboxylesterase
MVNAAFEGVKEAKVNGTTLAYREQGNGEPVVFVHGAISDLRTWEQQLPVVGRSYRAIAYSRRYARPNEDIERGVDDPWGRHAEDLAAFLREIDAAPAHLVGNSQGGFISLLTALEHPELVRTLVLEEPPVLSLFVKSTPPRVTELLRLFATRPRVALTFLALAASAFPPLLKALRQGRDDEAVRIFAWAAVGKEPYERLPEARKQQMRENASTLRALLLGAGFPPIHADEVRSVELPALLVLGDLSPPVHVHVTDRLEELLPNVERVEIPAASHLMHEENAPAVNEAIIGFLGRHRGRPT